MDNIKDLSIINAMTDPIENVRNFIADKVEEYGGEEYFAEIVNISARSIYYYLRKEKKSQPENCRKDGSKSKNSIRGYL